MSLILTIINSYEDNQVKKKKWAKEIFKMRLRLAPSSLDCCEDKKANICKGLSTVPTIE